ncbi:hypothetical protein ACFWBN_39645 [Streptomyces sp. NPDC059989]|uniref:hypothetical protein n=1 Tax=Streptomyces sp. NPDC059989 TaxID=3347026 RepID=UPI0036CA9FE1
MTDFPTSDRSNAARILARRSMTLVRAVARAAGEGLHHLTVVLATPDEFSEAECIINGPVPDESDANDPLVYAAYTLAVTTTGVNAMLAARTMHPDGTVRFMSWMISDLTAYPATAEQSRVAYCIGTDRDITAPLPPSLSIVDAPALV